MADPALVISLAAEFVGKPAFKQADTATDKLSKGVKNLAKTIGIAFSVTAVLAYGKAAVKAAAADEKAQKQLGLALKNVGLGRDAASSEAYIQKLQSEFGIVDDKLRPAYQTLAVATRSSSEAQRLLNLALDISASTGKDLSSVTGALSKAFLGNNTALGKLGVGISKADLKAKSFQEITDELAVTFKGSATAAANTFQGSMDKLAVSSANVQEIIGKGLIDAFKMLGDDGSVDNLAVQMESVAIYIADSIRGIGVLVGYIQSASDAAAKIPFLSQITDSLLKLSPLFGGIVGINALGSKAAADAARTADSAQSLAHLAELESRYTSVTLSTKKKITAEEAKQLKDKKLKLAIDKANLALGKGSNVFDIEKIQLAAAEKNQAEQLGKITSQAQLLQITNDLARLEVKQSILALEDAIKTNDVAAITNATAKLNADLLVLGALTGQAVKLKDIKDILASILPKDLINLANLNEAIRLLGLIGAGTGGSMATHGTPILGDPNKSPTGIPGPSPVLFPSIYASGARIDSAGGYNPFNPAMLGMTSGNASSSLSNITITIVDKTSGLIQVVQDAVIENNRYGNNLNYAGAIA